MNQGKSESRRQELKERISELAPWWHRIDLGGGIFTKDSSYHGEPVDHPRMLWERVREVTPIPFAGASVLDVGCNAGCCSFEAERLGAARVVGIDAVERHLAQARFVREVLGSQVDFRKMSAYDLSPDLGKFDIVLFLGVIYHCRHPLLILDRLRSVTDGLLVVESATFLHGGAQELGELPAQPMWIVDNLPDSCEALVNWFVPSPAALKAMLRASGFSRVLHEEIFMGRALVVAS